MTDMGLREQTDPADRPRGSVNPYTSHGHLVSGFTAEGWAAPEAVARCGGPAICGTCGRDAERIRLASRGLAPHAVDADPEFFYGLTMWVDGTSAQVRDTTVIVHAMNAAPPQEVEMSLVAARRLRDLLNVATARGHL